MIAAAVQARVTNTNIYRALPDLRKDYCHSFFFPSTLYSVPSFHISVIIGATVGFIIQSYITQAQILLAEM